MSEFADDPFAAAEALGLKVVLPKPDELMIDLDDPFDEKWMNKMISVAKSNGFVIKVDKITKSRGSGSHVYLTLPNDLTDLERICWQACLGSDRKRELLSLFRHLTTSQIPTLFFEKKDS